jgi:hypothetical protein
MSKLALALCAALIAGFACLAIPVMAGDAEYSITFTDGVVDPQTIEVPAGVAFTLVVKNAGTTPAEFESKPLHIEQAIAPGATAEINIHPLASGEYKFVEEFHEDQPTARGVISAK